MSIHWIRNVLIDNEKTTMEILMGDSEISDKCYVRINSGNEHWFVPKGETRKDIMQQGVDILKDKFDGKAITFQNGKDFDWL